MLGVFYAKILDEVQGKDVIRLILIHNHPSGNPKPSTSDINLTNNIVKAGKFLDLPVLDHVIIAGKSFTSLSDSGLI